jgi:hypothetical protein
LRNCGKIFSANAKCDLAILDPLFSILLVAASPRRAVGDGTPGPALNQENYETNPKQFLRILFKCKGFARSASFSCRQNEPKTPPFPLFILQPSEFPPAPPKPPQFRSPKSAKTPAKTTIVNPGQP